MQDYLFKSLRADAALTTSYVYYELDEKHLKNQVIFYLDLTIGAADSIDYVVEFSADGSDWYPETITTTSSGVSTTIKRIYHVTADQKDRIAIQIKDMAMRIGIKATGADVTGAKAKIGSIVGIA